MTMRVPTGFGGLIGGGPAPTPSTNANPSINAIGNAVQPAATLGGRPVNGIQATGGPAGGASGQSPSFAGTGTFQSVPYPINMGAITDQSQTGNIWNRLQGALGTLQPQSYQTTAAQLGPAPQYSPAQGYGATGTAVAGSPAWWQAAMGQAPTGYAAQGGYALGGPTGISTAGDLAWQGQQQGLANQLGLTAAGGGVSPADLQLRQGLEQGIGQQLSVLGSQRGNMGNAALTARSAADQAAAAEAGFNSQMGIQRAQETLAAQQALGNVLGQARGQAQNYNIAQAGLTQGMSLADLANAQAAQMQNTGFRQQTGLANLSNAQQMQLANLGYQNQAMQGNAQLGQGMDLANLQAANQFGLANLGNSQQAMLANLGNAQQQNLANQALQGQYGLTQGQFAQQTNLANQQAAYQGMGQYYNQLNALLGAGAGVAESNRAAQLAAQQLAVQQQIAGNQVNAQAYAASAAQNANLFGAGLNAAGGLLGGLINNFGGSGAAASPYATPSPTAPGYSPTLGYSQTITDPNLVNYFNTVQPQVSDRRAKKSVRTAGDTVHALLTALSDENLKTGIMGGNPMLQSYLEQYRSASGPQESVDPTLGESFRLTQTPRGMVGGSAGSSLGKQIGSSAGGAAGAAGGAALGSVVPGIGTIIGGLIGGVLGSQAGGAVGGAADSKGSAGLGVGGQVQASGMLGNENISDAPDYSQLADIGKSNVNADMYTSSDKENKVTTNDDARLGELGVLRRPDGGISTELSETVTDDRLNDGRPTNIPLLVTGQQDVYGLLAGGDPTDQQIELAIKRAAARVDAGGYLPSFGSVPEAVHEARARSAAKGAGVPLTGQQTNIANAGSLFPWPATPNLDAAMSDDREKEAIMGGNRGIQAFLQQQNAQQTAGANQGGMSNTFMQNGSPPTAQMDRQMPYNPNAGYGAPQWMGTPMQGGYNTDAGLSSMGGVYGGGYGVGGMSGTPGLTPGGITTMGGQIANATGAPMAGVATQIFNPTFNTGVAGASAPWAGNPATQFNTPAASNGLGPMAGVNTPIYNPIMNTSAAGAGSPVSGNPAIGLTRSAGVPSPLAGVATPINNPVMNTSAGGAVGPMSGNPALQTNPAAAPSPQIGGPYTAYAPSPMLANPAISIATSAPYLNPAARLSDEQQKQSVEPSNENLQQMLDALHAYSYQYKDPNAPGAAPGRQVGVMAQDLERSPLGSQFVIDTPHGKMVNYGQAAGTMMAGLAYHNERLDQHEAMLRSLLGGPSGGPHPF